MYSNLFFLCKSKIAVSYLKTRKREGNGNRRGFVRGHTIAKKTRAAIRMPQLEAKGDFEGISFRQSAFGLWLCKKDVYTHRTDSVMRWVMMVNYFVVFALWEDSVSLCYALLNR